MGFWLLKSEKEPKSEQKQVKFTGAWRVLVNTELGKISNMYHMIIDMINLQCLQRKT